VSDLKKYNNRANRAIVGGSRELSISETVLYILSFNRTEIGQKIINIITVFSFENRRCSSITYAWGTRVDDFETFMHMIEIRVTDNENNSIQHTIYYYKL